MWRAGFHKIDITPDAACGLMGYEFRRASLPAGNRGVHDPLFARAVALEHGGARAVLVSLDLAVLLPDLAARLRSAVARQLGIERRDVIVATTHTHSGPFPRLAADGCEPVPPAEAAYTHGLEERVLEAAVAAAGLLFPVRPRYREAPLGLGYDRRVSAPDGGVRHCWGPQEYPDRLPAAAADPTCGVLVLEQDGGPRRLILWNLGVHGVALGRTSRVVSADWPGLACGLLDEADPNTHSVFLAGAAGDVHPWIATQENPANAAVVARAAAGFVGLLAHATAPVGEGEAPLLRTAARELSLGGATMELVAWRLGCLCLAALPVELFGALGAALRRRVGAPLLLATNANGWTGYWPTREAFDEGGYEVEAARRDGRGPGDGELLVEAAAAMFESMGSGAGSSGPGCKGDAE